MDLSHIDLAVYGAYSCTKRWKNNLKSLIIAIFYALSYSKKMYLAQNLSLLPFNCLTLDFTQVRSIQDLFGSGGNLETNFIQLTYWHTMRTLKTLHCTGLNQVNTRVVFSAVTLQVQLWIYVAKIKKKHILFRGHRVSKPSPDEIWLKHTFVRMY